MALHSFHPRVAVSRFADLSNARFFARRGGRALVALSFLALLATGLAGCSGLADIPVIGGGGAGSSVTAPAQIRRGPDGSTLVVVNLTINGKGPFAFALDTGASLTLIDSELAQQLRLPVAGPPENISGVGGKQRVTPVNVRVWALGAATLPERTITSASLSELRRDDNIVGLLGSDVLSTFSAVTVDYANSQIILMSS